MPEPKRLMTKLIAYKTAMPMVAETIIKRKFSVGLSLFGSGIGFIHSNGLFGIGFSLFVVGIAAMNLVLDFDFIEDGAERGAPRYMEWFGAFALMVTLIWLYLEMLRLLAKIRSR